MTHRCVQMSWRRARWWVFTPLQVNPSSVFSHLRKSDSEFCYWLPVFSSSFFSLLVIGGNGEEEQDHCCDDARIPMDACKSAPQARLDIIREKRWVMYESHAECMICSSPGYARKRTDILWCKRKVFLGSSCDAWWNVKSVNRTETTNQPCVAALLGAQEDEGLFWI